jgi:Xaa-Pro aminopeptidase
VKTIVLYGDTYTCADLRHAVPLGLPDPLLYVEHEGSRFVVCDAMEVSRVAGLDGIAARSFEEFETLDGAVRGDRGRKRLEQAVRAVSELGVREAVVPRAFPLELADLLRGCGVSLVVREELFVANRRSKSPGEVEGVVRAQRAAEAGLAAALAVLERSEPDRDGELVADGEHVTVERLKREIAVAVASRGASCVDLIVSHGPQTAIGHHMGDGTLRAGEPVIVDLWPRDTESGCHADLTRSVVAGAVPPEIAEWHAAVRAALEHAVGLVRPGAGVAEIYASVCGFFEEAGYATPRRGGGPGPGRPGCRGLGHGVGLDVHEPPVFGLESDLLLQAGDVLAVEPGLYDPSLGGVRIEDLLLVTESGCELLTHCPYDLAPDAGTRRQRESR